MRWPPPTGLPIGARLIDGPRKDMVVTLLGLTLEIPRMLTWSDMEIDVYEFVRVGNTGEMVGVYRGTT